MTTMPMLVLQNADGSTTCRSADPVEREKLVRLEATAIREALRRQREEQRCR